jgi:iron(II)-dependent oxidoreductase
MAPSTTIPRWTDAEELAAALADAREHTLALVAPLSDDELERVHDPIMSPLIWDLGHIAAYEDLWLVHRHAGEPLLRSELAALYDAFETPRQVRGDIPLLRRADCLDYLAAVRERSLWALERVGLGDGTVHEMVLRHEMQHTETMLQTLALARLPGYRPPGPLAPPAAPRPGEHTGLEMVDVPAGTFLMGAQPDRFSYDNERPRHTVFVPGFRIGRTPITNATWLTFTEGGGYERREWWSREGWAWKEEYDITCPGGWVHDGREWSLAGIAGEAVPPDPDKPVVHVSWFEADALARALGARLPTEAEWEKAATWDQQTGATLPQPWGDGPPGPQHANLGQRHYGTAPAGAYPEGASPCGALGMLGDTWEWTSSSFGGYPGFRAHPYREYSEVFFGSTYKVLRGGSWATRARVATPTFRNWDLPQRRQIFSGVRIANDAEV